MAMLLNQSGSPCCKWSPAPGVWQTSDEESDRSEKVTESDQKEVINILLKTPFSGTLIGSDFRMHGLSRGVRWKFSNGT